MSQPRPAIRRGNQALPARESYLATDERVLQIHPETPPRKSAPILPAPGALISPQSRTEPGTVNERPFSFEPILSKKGTAFSAHSLGFG